MTNLKIPVGGKGGGVSKVYPRSFNSSRDKPLGWVLLLPLPSRENLGKRVWCGSLDVLVCLESILTIEKENTKLFRYQMYQMWGINEARVKFFLQPFIRA